ncbi:GRAM domain-containing protein [Fusobacterium sp.]|uniref:GRAM domain-containing protein n=1 Tax=Fusobacterium sp. TaxID=68766 RepID=UPI00261C8729|nr:GRAM domain-containing protein [Fusobacterium sp.]
MLGFENFKLKEDEKLIVKKQVSYVKNILVFPQPNPGNLSITDKRIVFEPTQGRSGSAFMYELNEIDFFTVGMMNTITIVTKNGEKYKLTGLFNKALIKGLEDVNIKREK